MGTRRGSDTPSTETLGALPVQLPEELADSQRPFLVLFGGGSSRVVPLLDDRAYVVGRSRDADIQVDDASISRRHASFTVKDGRIALADLDSSNGTYVDGQRLRGSVALQAGDIVSLGAIQIVAHGPGPSSSFDRRLQIEVERALRHRRPLSLVILDFGDPARVPEATVALRGVDALADLGQGSVAVLLPETAGADAESAVKRILHRLAGKGLRPRAGLSSFGDEIRDAAALRAGAEVAVGRALPGAMVRADGVLVDVQVGDRTVVFAEPAMVQLVSLLRRLARTELPVLLTGETGVGKEIFARALHSFSARRDGPFEAVNCPAIPESLAESELFGHVRGAFTGAERNQIGRIEMSHGGTLFLDEVADLPLSIQAKLLRVLEERSLTAVGDRETRQVDLRVVAATNRDLRAELAAGRFRTDLYHRLTGAALVIPPLRERPRDLPLLVRRFAADACARLGRPDLRIPAGTMARLARHGWPGNIRELKNAIESAVAVTDGEVLESVGLPAESEREPPQAPAAPAPPAAAADLKSDLAEYERGRIIDALEKTGGNQTRAAKLLGISRMTLSQRLDAYGLPRPRKGRT